MILNFILTLLFSLVNILYSSHFYGGSISSKPIKDNGDNVTFNFTIRFSYRTSYSYETYCDSDTILNKTLIGPHYNIYCVAGCEHAYSAIGNSQIYCLSYSKEIDWTFGSRIFSYTIPKIKKYQIEFYGSDWRNLVVFGYNRTGSSWELRHSIDSTNQSYNKKINSSPETLMSPITSLPINNFHVLDIPYIDIDDDQVRCRWADWKSKECRDVCMAVPFGILDNIECKIYLNTSQAQLGFYAAAIQLEDFKGNNFSHPISSVPLQFLIHIVEETNCTLPPNLSHIYPDKSCIAIDQKVNITYFAGTQCENVNITEIQIMSAPGSILYDMQYDFKENRWSRSVSLNSSENGHNLICARAVDSDFKSSNFSCLRVSTGVSPPYVLKSSLSPTGKLNKSFDILNFTAEFSAHVRKPNSNRLITIHSSQTQELIQSISTNDVSYFDNSSEISFPVNMSMFSDGDFYVLFDYGIAVSTDFCSPISEKIDDTLFWKFTVELIDELSTIEANTTKTIFTNSIPLSETFPEQSNKNCSNKISEIKKEEKCNTETLSLVFSIFCLIPILFHHIFLYLFIRQLKRKNF